MSSVVVLKILREGEEMRDTRVEREEIFLSSVLTTDPTIAAIRFICFYNFNLDHYQLMAITQLDHHGMLFVSLGYTFGSGMFEMDDVKGGSTYGVGTFARDGYHQPTEARTATAFTKVLQPSMLVIK
ncbi:NAD(P)H dehydrogenase (quinone) FQR1 [Spatholobus suberectus]|nr:NAD(P)H dehydrogenase (quinone) FQR1 [Spatholobus suberectus]